MVTIPSYRGPTEWYTDDGVPIVPIVPSVHAGKRMANLALENSILCVWHMQLVFTNLKE